MARTVKLPLQARARAFLRWVAMDILPAFGTGGTERSRHARMTSALGEAPPQISYQPFRLPGPEDPAPHA